MIFSSKRNKGDSDKDDASKTAKADRRPTMLSSGSKQAGDQMNTILGKDTTFTGTVEVKGGLRIDGVVKGKIISSDEVTIGATGVVEAEIEANAVIVAGRLLGNIVASDKIELQANCDVEGDLRSKSLIIEQGAIFCGGCQMKEGSRPNSSSSSPSSSSSSKASMAISMDDSSDDDGDKKAVSSFGLPFSSKSKEKMKA
ncbi:polymer-forming cytoskeletal protein [bacterium AH-315-J21]|nr:polymer-forming cytoskeletal protein [bacterium AH-315-J21]